MQIVDVWMQHPTPELLSQPFFDSLRRWAGSLEQIPELPLELTVQSMDDAGVGIGLLQSLKNGIGGNRKDPAIAKVVKQLFIALDLFHKTLGRG